MPLKNFVSTDHIIVYTGRNVVKVADKIVGGLKILSAPFTKLFTPEETL